MKLFRITILISFLLATIMVFPIHLQQTEGLEGTEEQMTKYEYYDVLIEQYSNEYGVDKNLVHAIIACENKGRDTKLQSQLYYNFTNEKLGIYKGEREYSFGLVQINLHYNPNITYEQATDPDFSIEFLTKNLSKGNHSWWASYTSGCYKKYL